MDREEKIALTELNLNQALTDYFMHTDPSGDNDAIELDNIGDRFVKKLAKTSVIAKEELRELFRKSPAWNEELDAIVINGTRTHNPDYRLIYDLGYSILEPAIQKHGYNSEESLDIQRALAYFRHLGEENYSGREDFLAAMERVAPKSYQPNKKPSRIFMSICKALGVADESANSQFSRLYAQFADEISAKKINFKLFMSINPAHFVTMSNPKFDDRGCTMTSCHSFNSIEYEYNNGCTGYARDPYTFIVFTTADPSDPETLNNRKTTRQIFAYKPGNGLLLQSRLYNTNGGTHGTQAESKVYRDLIQREISDLEDAPNLWKTRTYYDNDDGVHFREGIGFGGYTDWTYRDFDAKFSIRQDHLDDFENFEIGTWGICASCGCDTDHGVFCEDCEDELKGYEYCDCCGDRCDRDDLYTVYDSDNNEQHVCGYCRNNNYTYCDECGEYVSDDAVTEVHNGDHVCNECLEENYVRCEDCEDWVRSDDTYDVIGEEGWHRTVCEDCRDNDYTDCDECGNYVSDDTEFHEVHDEYGCRLDVCDECFNESYAECDECGEAYPKEMVKDGLCPECAKKHEKEEELA